MGKEIKDIVSGKTIKVECETCFDEEGSHACVRPSHGHSEPGQRRESRMSEKLQAREWLINGGAGYEDGADGLRASMWSSEAVIEALDDYGEYLLEAALSPAAPLEEYPHLGICNGDHRYPAGVPGHSCCCFNISTEYLQAAARKIRAEEGAAATPAPTDDALYAAYANHCAIQGKVPMTAISWRKAGRPKEPSAALPKSIPDALRLNTDDEHWIQTIESCPYNHGLCLGVIRKLLAAPSSPIEVVQPASASLSQEGQEPSDLKGLLFNAITSYRPFGQKYIFSKRMAATEVLIKALEEWESAPPQPVQPASASPFAYACPANCGCIWRDNKDGTMSLFGPRSQSCKVCEPLSLDRLIPLWLAAQPSVREGELSAEMVKEVTGELSREWCKQTAERLNALLRSKESA